MEERIKELEQKIIDTEPRGILKNFRYASASNFARNPDHMIGYTIDYVKENFAVVLNERDEVTAREREDPLKPVFKDGNEQTPVVKLSQYQKKLNPII